MNIIEALELRGIDYREHSSKRDEIFLCCPFCIENGTSPDTRFRLSLNVVTGWMNCFNGGCGKKSKDADYTFQELNRVLETGQLELIAELARKKKPTAPVRLPEDFTPISYRESARHRGMAHWHKTAIDYARQRNIAGWQLQEKNIGYSLVGEFRYRIIVPIYRKRKLVGIVARAFVYGMEPKYKNSIGEKTLFNYPDSPRKTVVLSEGAFDALSIERVTRDGFGKKADSLAVLGHSLTEKQLGLLKPYEHIILWPDPDEAGLVGFTKMARVLESHYPSKKLWMVVPRLGGRKLEYDPSELTPAEIRVKLNGIKLYDQELEARLSVERAFQE